MAVEEFGLKRILDSGRKEVTGGWGKQFLVVHQIPL
jgi:hypothetical protein